MLFEQNPKATLTTRIQNKGYVPDISFEKLTSNEAKTIASQQIHLSVYM